MFKLNGTYEVDRRILKSEYVRFLPAKTSTINTPKCQIYIIIPRKSSVLSLLNSYNDLNIKFIKKADSCRYANGNDEQLVNLGPIDLFSSFKFGKHLE